MDAGSHRLDLLAWWFDLPETLVAKARNDREKIDDSAVALMTLTGGADAVVSFHWNSKTAGDEILILGSQASLSLLPCDGPELSLSRGDRLEHRQCPKPPNAHYPLIDDFARAVVEGRPPRFDGTEGAKASQIMDAIYRSAAEGTWADVR